MDLATAQRLISAADPKSLAALKHGGNDAIAAKAVAGQFAALLVQNVMQGSDGTALPIAGDGTGGNVVSGLFANAISQMAASGDKLGLADLLFHSIEDKERLAGSAGGAKAPTKGEPAKGVPAVYQTSEQSPERSGRPPHPALSKLGYASPTLPFPLPPQGGEGRVRGAAPNDATQSKAPLGLPLRPYWQQGGVRPLAAALESGGARPVLNSPQLTAAIATPPRLVGAPVAASGPGSPALASNNLTGAPLPAAKVQSFVRELRPMMVEAGRQLGVSPTILLAHAALETGWGRSVVGNNLFGIKAGPSWQGSQFTTLTHEVEDGERVSREAAFRAYPSLDASVEDYVALIGGNPRYQGLIGSGNDIEAYGRGLMAGGYASDTDYGSKLEAVAAEAAAAFAAPSAPPGVMSPFGLFATPGWTE